MGRAGRASRFGEKRVEVLGEIVGAVRHHSKVPTVRELADRFDVSPGTMHSWLTKLSESGLIEWTPRSHRSLRCTPDGLALLAEGEKVGP